MNGLNDIVSQALNLFGMVLASGLISGAVVYGIWGAIACIRSLIDKFRHDED